jgi:hypothetical protein
MIYYKKQQMVMKPYLLLLLSLAIGIHQKIYAQHTALIETKLEYIKDYNIMLDGGCSSYTYDTASLEKKDYIFVIAALKTRTAFMKVAGHQENVFLKLVGKNLVRGDKEYHHIFTGGGYNVRIDTKRTVGLDAFHDLYIGTLTIEYKGSIVKIKVQGAVDKDA